MFKNVKILCLSMIFLSILSLLGQSNSNTIISLETRQRMHAAPGNSSFEIITKKIKWETSHTAIIICDMWDQHWCRGASKRVAELAPIVNRFVSIARHQGVLIVHAPSGVVDYYENQQARQNALLVPKAQNTPSYIGSWCESLEGEPKESWPIDQSDGGCDCQPQCQQGHPWTRQIDSIEIFDDDIISDDGIEIWAVFEDHDINNVILVGVHTNMCVIGRPFGLRNMVRAGKNVVLCRDLTDTMYNSRKAPFVSHFEGTDLVIAYIESFICPTMVSTAITDEPPFKFSKNRR